jgi:hypothetical protein
MKCKLSDMFKKRLNFIMLMQKHRPGSYPAFPLDMSKKESQYACRDLALRGVEEMFEALAHLKNWKPHRLTVIDDELDKEAFLEEIVDAFNYFLSVLVITGFDDEDLHEAYVKKDKIIRERVLNGY